MTRCTGGFGSTGWLAGARKLRRAGATQRRLVEDGGDVGSVLYKLAGLRYKSEGTQRRRGEHDMKPNGTIRVAGIQTIRAGSDLARDVRRCLTLALRAWSRLARGVRSDTTGGLTRRLSRGRTAWG